MCPSKTCSVHWSCWSPPGVPRARDDSPSRAAIVGERVVRGRLPGSSEFGRPSSSQNIWARVPSGKPSEGITGAPQSQPPLGVAETMFPQRSTTSRWTVSPRVGSPTPGRDWCVGHRLREPGLLALGRLRAEVRSRPPRRAALVAPPRSPAKAARRVAPRLKSGSPYQASRSANASFAHSVIVCTQSALAWPMAPRSNPSSSRSCWRKTGAWLQGPALKTSYPW